MAFSLAVLPQQRKHVKTGKRLGKMFDALRCPGAASAANPATLARDRQALCRMPTSLRCKDRPEPQASTTLSSKKTSRRGVWGNSSTHHTIRILHSPSIPYNIAARLSFSAVDSPSPPDTAIMFSRTALRQVASKPLSLRVSARSVSVWSNVPQGPPVSDGVIVIAIGVLDR